MSALQFISNIAWPAAVLVLGFVYRATINELILGRLSRVKAGSFEVELEQAQAQAAQGVEESALGERVPTLAVGTGDVSGLRDLARSAPRSVVLAGYERVVEALRRCVAEVVGEKQARGMREDELQRFAVEQGAIGRDTSDAIDGVRTLRNLAAHGPNLEVSEQRALEFLSLVETVVYALRVRAGGSAAALYG